MIKAISDVNQDMIRRGLVYKGYHAPESNKNSHPDAKWLGVDPDYPDRIRGVWEKP